MKAGIAKHWVLCEGLDDSRVMEALAVHMGIADKLHFEHYAESGFHAYLKTLRSRPELTSGAIGSILVTKDADSDFSKAWQSVSDAVSKAFDIALPEPGSWVQAPDGPRLAGWVMPGPGKTGMIETLCLDAARETGEDIFSCLDSFVECVNATRDSKLHEKARFHIWTVIAQSPGAQDRLSLQRALNQMPPNWDAVAFEGLRKVLNKTIA